MGSFECKYLIERTHALALLLAVGATACGGHSQPAEVNSVHTSGTAAKYPDIPNETPQQVRSQMHDIKCVDGSLRFIFKPKFDLPENVKLKYPNGFSITIDGAPSCYDGKLESGEPEYIEIAFTQDNISQQLGYKVFPT